jgi:hypothetical protein
MTILRHVTFALAALAALPALADPLAPGCWVGGVKKSDGTTDYTIQLWLAGDPRRPIGSLHLGNPKSCRLVASYKDDTSFSLTRPNGGICRTALADKTLSVTPDGLAFPLDGQTVQASLKPYDGAKTEESCLTQ